MDTQSLNYMKSCLNGRLLLNLDYNHDTGMFDAAALYVDVDEKPEELSLSLMGGFPDFYLGASHFRQYMTVGKSYVCIAAQTLTTNLTNLAAYFSDINKSFEIPENLLVPSEVPDNFKSVLGDVKLPDLEYEEKLRIAETSAVQFFFSYLMNYLEEQYKLSMSTGRHLIPEGVISAFESGGLGLGITSDSYDVNDAEYNTAFSLQRYVVLDGLETAADIVSRQAEEWLESGADEVSGVEEG